MEIFLSRQPVFDRHEQVWGYEQLHGPALENPSDKQEQDSVVLEMHGESLSFHLEKLAAGKRVFLNFFENFLLGEDSLGLPEEMVVLEIPKEVPGDEDLQEACRNFKERGHLLALKDFVWPKDAKHPLAEMADMVKIDFQKTSSESWKEVSSQFSLKSIKLLAEKIETWEEFREARELGFHYFQGQFFSRPEIISREEIPRYKLRYVKLLNELGRTHLDFQSLQKLIEGNPPLVHKLLSYINSAFFGVSCRVASVQQALLILGEQEIRKWASLAIIHHLGRDQPQELLRLSLLRAHLCEILGTKIGLGTQSSELFLVGLLSLLDVYLGRPLAEVLTGMPLAPLIKETLLGSATPYRQVFDIAVANERANWERVSCLAKQVGFKENEVVASYLEAVDSVEQSIQFWTQ